LRARAIVTDDVEKIRAQVKAWIADPAVDVIITTGGTGFTGRDVTPEALEPLFEKRMDGFATLFLMVSHAKIGTSAIQTRATAGVAGATYIFCLPGSPGACRDAWDEILVHQLDYRYRPATSSRSCRGSTSILRRRQGQGRDRRSAAQYAAPKGKVFLAVLRFDGCAAVNARSPTPRVLQISATWTDKAADSPPNGTASSCR
jgi:molybdenum cofactor biosynthesis protein B